MNGKQVTAVVVGAAVALGIAVSGGTGGLRRVSHNTGMLSGDGTSSSQLAVTVYKGNGFGGTGSAGDPLTLTKTYDGGWFGDGWDGDCTFDGTTTVGNSLSTTFAPTNCWTSSRTPRGCEVQGTGASAGGVILKAYQPTRDLYCDHVVISASVYVYHPGVRIFAKSGIVNNGWIGAMGQPPVIGSEANGGANGSQITVSVGASGGSQNASGSSGNNGVPGRFKAQGGTGGSGGQGGAGVGQPGGSLGTTTLADSFSPLYNALGWIGTQHSSLPAAMGGGGGGGRGDGFGGCSGGGGGAAGSIVIISSPTWSGSGYVSASGGNGAWGTDVCPGGARFGGGGGGGKGGMITLIYSSGAAPNTDVSGGDGGNQSNGTGTAATDGSPGLVVLYKIGPS